MQDTYISLCSNSWELRIPFLLYFLAALLVYETECSVSDFNMILTGVEHPSAVLSPATPLGLSHTPTSPAPTDHP
jgi:hypothetical protein